jgi:hypothetical protein
MPEMSADATTTALSFLLRKGRSVDRPTMMPPTMPANVLTLPNMPHCREGGKVWRREMGIEGRG